MELKGLFWAHSRSEAAVLSWLEAVTVGGMDIIIN